MNKLLTALFFLISFAIGAAETLPLTIHFRAPEFSLNGVSEISPLSRKLSLRKKIESKYAPISKKEDLDQEVLKSTTPLAKEFKSSKEFKNDEDLNEIVKSIKNKKIEKSVQKPDYDQDGLVMYDYSKIKEQREVPIGNNEVIDSIQTVASAPISNPLKAVIEREMNNSDNYQKEFKKVASKKNIESFSTEAVQANFSIKAMEVVLNSGKIIESIDSFQLQTPFHEDQILTADMNGKVDLNVASGVFRGTLLYNNAVATRVELPIDKEGGLFQVPLLTYDSVRKYMDENKLEGHGGHYIVEVGDKVADVDIEVNSSTDPYELRVLFDETFNEVKQGDEYRYMLFFGIRPGNVTVKTIGHNGEFADKIALISPDEVLFEYLEIEKKKAKNYKLAVNNTMSVVPSPINISSDKIKTIIGKGESIKLAESSYQYSSSTNILGMKEYLELDFLNDKVYFSLNNEKEINIPSNEFISEVLNQYEIDGIEERCLVQVNLKKEVIDIKTALESDMGFESSELLYLDKDGIFTDEVSPITKKVFIMGHRQGVINLKITDIDGITSHQRTFCSAATYLVEHF